MKVTRKIQTNRGLPRIWLEGKLLDAHGFSARTRYAVDIAASRIRLAVQPDGPRAVSGKDRPTEADPAYRHPVIDLHQKDLLVFTGPVEALGGATVQVEFKPGVITIRKE